MELLRQKNNAPQSITSFLIRHKTYSTYSIAKLLPL